MVPKVCQTVEEARACLVSTRYPMRWNACGHSNRSIFRRSTTTYKWTMNLQWCRYYACRWQAVIKALTKRPAPEMKSATCATEHYNSTPSSASSPC